MALEALVEEAAFGGLVLTPPGRTGAGKLHPITKVLAEVIDHFHGLVLRSPRPELEDEWHNFDALNIPKDHPARDVWDTFYLSSGEISEPTPARFRSNPRVSRATSPNHCSAMAGTKPLMPHLARFNQVEGLFIDRDVTLGHLEATLRLVERLMGRK